MGLPIAEITNALARQVRILTGKPIYLLSDIEPIFGGPPEHYAVTIEVVRGYNTAQVWTNTTRVMLDSKFEILEIKKKGEKSFQQNGYTGEGFGSPHG